MSRLKVSDIDRVEKQLHHYDDLFFRQTGHTMEQIAKKAVGITEDENKIKTAVIPITSGLGLITGFSDAVGAILRYCGIETFVTKKTDVAGLQQAYLEKCDIAFLADDNVCAAFNIKTGVQSDNGWATGRGFAAALIEGIKKRGDNPVGKHVLIIGAGPVGRAAADYVSEKCAIPVICDLDKAKAVQLADELTSATYVNAPAPINEFDYIIDACTAGNFIKAKEVTPNTIIAAPGMPCGITAKAKEKAIVIHNPLELGIITMYYDCIKQSEE